VEKSTLTYSPQALAVIAMGLLVTGIMVESFDPVPRIGNALILGASFMAFGAFVFCFINYFGTLP